MQSFVRKFILPILFISSTVISSAQNYQDVLRYSERFLQSTARTAGAGNAFGALGADFGSVPINPAGLGLFRNAEFEFSMGFNKQSSRSTYLGQTGTDEAFNFNVGSVGIVLPNYNARHYDPDARGWLGVNVGIGMNRTNNFHTNLFLQGVNRNNSILDFYRDDAQGIRPDDLSTNAPYGYLAYSTFLLEQTGRGDTDYKTLIDSFEDVENLQLSQTDIYQTTGAMNDVSIAVAGNFSNRFYIGGSFNLATVGFHSFREFTEVNLNPYIYGSHTLNESVSTTGTGISLTLGAIGKVTDHLRLGGSIQFPTYYWLTDTYDQTMFSDAYGKTNYPEFPLDIGVFDYAITTPFRAVLSGALMFGAFGKGGFVSVDYEYTNYSSARFSNTYFNMRDRNQVIEQVLRAGNNIRVGAEKLIGQFAIRAGYGYYGSPYSREAVEGVNKGVTQVISAGVGYRETIFYMDLAYQYYTLNGFRLPYTIQTKPVEGANYTSIRNNIMLTVGTRF